MKTCALCVSRGGLISSSANATIMLEGWVKFPVTFENEATDIFNIEYFAIPRFFRAGDWPQFHTIP